MRSFRIAAVFATASVGSGIVSLLLYPGGTYLDRSAHGYSFFHNLLSDAGMTVAFNGQPNPAGSAFAMATSTLAAVALVCCATGLIRVYSSSPAQKSCSLAAAALLLLSGIGFVGAVLSPPNQYPAVHMRFSTLALGAAAAASLSLAVATVRDTRFSRWVPLGWIAVAVMIPALLSSRWWAPAVTTGGALVFHAILQKFVIFASIGILICQSVAASRVARTPHHAPEVPRSLRDRLPAVRMGR